MRNRKILTRVPALLLALIFLIPGPMSHAEDRDRHDGRHDGRHDDRHYNHYRERPSFGLRFSFVPEDAFSVRVREGRYYYYDGLYYTQAGPDYVLVAPPMGAVVTGIPPEFRPVVINGVTYYTDNGIYYVYTRDGYQVVPQPVMSIQPSPVIVTQSASVVPVQVAAPVIVPATTSGSQGAIPTATVQTASTVTPADESFTVNIPNNKGGYTAVTVKRSGNGFAGPQGEYYAEFPKVTQLQVMYGK